MDERVTLYSDPTDPDLLAMPFDVEGFPLKRIVWIEKGVLRNLSYTRFWAQRQKVPPTGTNIYDGTSNVLGGGLKMTGGTKTTDELIAGCEHGVLVTHFFYIRSLEPRTVLYTGLTRDGAFLIEKGKVTRPLKNLRWNESPLLMLNRLEDIGRPEAGRRRPPHARAAHPRLQLHVAVGRGVGTCTPRCSPPRRYFDAEAPETQSGHER